MAKPSTPRTASARPTADQVDPAVPNTDLTVPANELTATEAHDEALDAVDPPAAEAAPDPTDADEDARTAPNDAPAHDAEPSRGGSTPKPQNGNTLYPDTNTKPDEKAMEAAAGSGATPEPDPLLTPREDVEIIAGATDEVELKTTGSFMLMDPLTGKHFDQSTPTKTPNTQWVQDQVAAKRLA